MVGPGFLDLPARSVKPRGTGITHVLDRGLPLGYCADLLESAGAYVDVWKFGWGISYLDQNLPAKLELLARGAPCWRSPGRRAAPPRSSTGPAPAGSRAWRSRRAPCP